MWDFMLNKDSNIKKFVDYFQKGCKRETNGTIGMEAEHFVVNKKDSSAVSYYGEHGIEALLERLSVFFLKKHVKEGYLIALENAEYIITIEPAAQLEVSIMPQESVREIERIYKEFTVLLQPVLEEWDYRLITAGYHLTERSEELALIPKKRYQYMDQYFAAIGTYGCCMMRGTASVQVAIDYYSEEDFIKTYRAAVALGPLFALVTDNAPVFQGKPFKKHMLRAYIWERVDEENCLIVPGTFDDGFGFEAYARYLYEMPMIFDESKEGECYVGKASLKDICAWKEMMPLQMEHGLSIAFPDVRLKQYMEIRVGDSMPFEYAISYVALIKGLFQNREKLFELYKELEQHTQFQKMTEEEVQNGKQQLIEYGYAGEIYGQRPNVWLNKMLALAECELGIEETMYLERMKELVQSQKRVCDMIY